MTTSSVFDILVYVFDHYMLVETPRVPERERLARDLERAGFAPGKVERALDWLTELACGHERAARAGRTQRGNPRGAVRIYSESEQARLSAECRGLLVSLEQSGALTAQQRELVIERLLALESEELDVEQLRWVVLMVLSSEPGPALGIERLAPLVADLRTQWPH
jgi:Smg protein